MLIICDIIEAPISSVMNKCSRYVLRHKKQINEFDLKYKRFLKFQVLFAGAIITDRAFPLCDAHELKPYKRE